MGFAIDNRRPSIDNVAAMKRALIGFLLFAAPVFAQTPSSMVVTTQWLASRLGQPDLAIVHIGLDRSQYDAGHIPGARFLPLSQIVINRGQVANELPGVEQLKRTLESVGIGDNTRVVLYSNNANLYAARLWWTMDYLGAASQAALLDGSLEQWRDEKHPLSKDVPPAPHTTFTPRLRPQVLVNMPAVADASWLATHIDHPSLTLIDARPPEQYSGADPGEDISRPGHIPGAANLYWVNLLENKDDPRLLPVPDLRKLLRGAGASSGPLIVYCRSGMQSSYLYFVARFLGYDVAMYDGSFLEWSNSSVNPVEKGTSKK